MFDNLDTTYDINKHIEQGVEFKKLEGKIRGENDHKFLQDTSGPEWESIREAMSSYDSTSAPNKITISPPSDEAKNFNNLVSSYSAAYNIYTSTMLKKTPTDADRVAMEASLTSQKASIIAAANQLKITERSSTRTDLFSAIEANNTSLQYDLFELKRQLQKSRQINNKYDKDTVGGIIETSQLNTTSMYYHLFVYLAIAITLIAFTLNLITNPAANPIQALYVVGALFVVFFISQKYAI
jgi:hypothetical protein